MKTFQEFVAEAQKCWPGYKKKGTKKLFGKTYNNCVKEEIELEESSTGERTRGKATLARGRGADMTRQERSTAAVAKKAGLKGTGKYSTKDLRTPSRLYTNNNPDGYGNKGSTKLNHYVTTHASPRSAATSSDLDIIKKREYLGVKDGKLKYKHHPSADSVRRAKDFRKAIVRSGGDKRGKVHDVSIIPNDAYREKNQTKNRMTLGRNLVQGVKDVPKHLKAAGAKKGEVVTGKPAAVMPGEDKKTGAEKRGKLYGKILGSRASKRSEKTGVMVGSIKEVVEIIQELEESSTGEKTRGRATLARGRGADMTKSERTTAAIAKKAGLKGTGKYSTKDLRTRARDYTTYDRVGINNDIGDFGSTEQDHYIRTHPSVRAAAKGETLITKMKPAGRTSSGMTKLKTAPSGESVRRVKDFRKAIVRSGGDKRGKVHTVAIMHRDSDIGKGDSDQQMERGRNFIQAIKDTGKHLKKAGAKKGETVIAEPAGVMPGEDKKTGAAKRAKLYKKIFGKRVTKASPKTGLMTGKV
jgi:Tfp pilus assembly major pilin PilA